MDNVSWSNGLSVWDELNMKSTRSWAQKIMIAHNLMIQTPVFLKPFLEVGQTFIRPWAKPGSVYKCFVIMFSQFS